MLLEEVVAVIHGGGAADISCLKHKRPVLNILMSFLLPSLNRKQMLSATCQPVGAGGGPGGRAADRRP